MVNVRLGSYASLATSSGKGDICTQKTQESWSPVVHVRLGSYASLAPSSGKHDTCTQRH